MTQQEYNNGAKIWADKAFRFAVRCCDNHEVDRDAVQEALTTLWDKRDKVPQEKALSFVMTITHRQLMDHFRRQRHQFDSNQALKPDDSAPPDENFDLKEELDRAMATLPEVQRAILQLRDIEGYAYKEIANILNLSDQQVQVYLFRARVALKKKLIADGYQY